MEIDKEAAKKYLALDKRQAKQKKQKQQEVAMDEDEVVQAVIAGKTAEEINVQKRKKQ